MLTNVQINEIWEIFNLTARQYGYDVITHNNKEMGIGSICSKDDPFCPLFKLCIWEAVYTKQKELVKPASFSVHVEDRNGNSVLAGPLCAVYIAEDNGNDTVKEFAKMCEAVFSKYSAYSRICRLDFVFNEYEVERVQWNK